MTVSSCYALAADTRIECLNLRFLAAHALFLKLGGQLQHPLVISRNNLFELRQILFKVIQYLLSLFGTGIVHMRLDHGTELLPGQTWSPPSP